MAVGWGGLVGTIGLAASSGSALWVRAAAIVVAFLVGGAEGHPEAVREEADLLLSLSPLTLQHELALLVLMEQLYRVLTLRAGHPYHRP